MKYTFRFYKEEDFDAVEQLAINSYSFDCPIFGLSRMEFSNGLHPRFCGIRNAWERTVGIFSADGRIVSCAIDEGVDQGEVFFLFDSIEHAKDKQLLNEMIFHAKTTMSCVKDEENIRRFVKLFIPRWNDVLIGLVEEQGFEEEWQEQVRIKYFSGEKQEVKLPEGYTLVDGTTTPAFYLANVHMASFNYSISNRPDGVNAFDDIRKQNHYDPELDLCILDPQGRPVAMAMLWYDEKMPYCELEPLGVAWWERRKGLATAILNEACNRIVKRYPACKGIRGGDQVFYERLGYGVETVIPCFKWETDIYPSWDERSEKRI